MKRSFFSTARSFLALTLLVGGTVHAAPRAAESAKQAAASPWRLQDGIAARTDREVLVLATKYQAFTADLNKLRATLAGAPLDLVTAAARGTVVMGNPVELSLPMPRDGRLARFRVEEVAIMEAGLAAKYPDIKTYRGVGIDDPAAQLALDVTPYGMHAQILSPSGRVYINPYYFGAADNLYASYYMADAKADPTAAPWVCEFKSPRLPVGAGQLVAGEPVIGTPDEAREAGITPTSRPAGRTAPQPQTSFGGSLRTYRLACAANHQFVATTGGTKALGQAAVVVVINRVSAIYEADCGIRLVLVANNDQVVYASAAADPGNGQTTADPYANGTGALNQNTPNLNTVIGSANYDIGHVFTTGSGGVANLGVVCGSSKGGGTTGRPSPVGDDFNVDYVVHEMGHQFGANHTFNGGVTGAGSCSGGNRSAAHAYEPGSGTTIMAYAGICGTNNDLQPHSDSMFHNESLSEILTYAAAGGASCPVNTGNGNSIPTVSAGASYTIPTNTPFTLTGSATDPDSDVLTYSWEERDRGTAQTDANAVDDGTSPLFRTFAPVYSPSRTFPKMSDVVNKTATIGEKLPTIARTINMRLTVRDNRTSGGATNSADTTLTAVVTTAPFAVTAPNTALVVGAGNALSVAWNVVGTNLTPFNATNVKITLSTDGGYTYPYTLAASTPNSGSTTVTLPPGVKSTSARVKIEALGNVFFDISDVNFTIQ